MYYYPELNITISRGNGPKTKGASNCMILEQAATYVLFRFDLQKTSERLIHYV